MAWDWLENAEHRVVSLLAWKRYSMSTPGDAFAGGRWYGRKTAATEKWLRSAAEAGNCFAMERLAENLLQGPSTEISRNEALRWLKRAAEIGSVSAATTLGLWLLEDDNREQFDMGKLLLTRAAAKGYLPAATELALHLLTRAAPVRDVSQGAYWLRRAAVGGDRLAMVLLGRYLIAGEYLAPSPIEGREWLALAGATKGVEIPKLGLYVYSRSTNGTTPTSRKLLAQEASSLFLDGHLRGDAVGSINLAYMVRRAEVPAENCPPMDELLSKGLLEKRPFAIVNEALRRSRGVQCTADWTSADRLMASLSVTSGVLEWWLKQSEVGDPEGHLVLGWLVRHGLSADPEGLEPRQRFRLLGGTEWECPEWLN